ncbi:hypothetical protein [Bacillus sp. AK128]
MYPGQEIKKGNESIWLKTNPYVGIDEIGANEISAQLIEAKEQLLNLDYSILQALG